MHAGIVAVWDHDREYAERLSEYLRRQGGLGAAVVSFGDLLQLKQVVDTHQTAVALVGDAAAESPWLEDTPVVVLTEEGGRIQNGRSPSGRRYAYKYQPAREILRIVSGLQARPMDGPAVTAGVQRVGIPARIRGIYSPVGGCLKTSLGLVMGCILSEEKRCLFISLEAHSGFRTLLGRQYPVDLSDLFAAIRQGGTWQALLSDALQPFGKLQYIPPVIWPVDVREAEFQELEELLRQLALCGRFDEIIIDVGQDLARPEKVLALCDQIYCPEKKDVFSQAKLTEYDCYLRVSGYESLCGRMRSIPLSRLEAEGEGDLGQWQRWECMIPAVRRILEEEADGTKEP